MPSPKGHCLEPKMDPLPALYIYIHSFINLCMLLIKLPLIIKFNASVDGGWLGAVFVFE